MSRALTVIARNADEMVEAQKRISSWAEGKMAECVKDGNEAQQSLEIAKLNGWDTNGIRIAIKLARKQGEFYHKILSASRLGYVIVPNFPIDIFAIRTAKENPRKGETQYAWDQHEQSSESPEAGEGRYVNALPEVWSQDRPFRDGEQIKQQRHYFAKEFKDVAFPITAVKPQVLDDTARAMAHEIFDEIGISQGMIRGRGDPMVIGQIIYRPLKKRVSFLISWWLSTEDLEIKHRAH